MLKEQLSATKEQNLSFSETIKSNKVNMEQLLSENVQLKSTEKRCEAMIKELEEQKKKTDHELQGTVKISLFDSIENKSEFYSHPFPINSSLRERVKDFFGNSDVFMIKSQGIFLSITKKRSKFVKKEELFFYNL